MSAKLYGPYGLVFVAGVITGLLMWGWFFRSGAEGFHGGDWGDGDGRNCGSCRKPLPDCGCASAQQGGVGVCPTCPKIDWSKYILKASIPPCPDMRQYMLKSECPAPPDMSRYILKSAVPPCPPCISTCSKPCKIGDCPPCPRPRCPPQESHCGRRHCDDDREDEEAGPWMVRPMLASMGPL
jgi:hypothetical protein